MVGECVRVLFTSCEESQTHSLDYKYWDFFQTIMTINNKEMSFIIWVLRYYKAE